MSKNETIFFLIMTFALVIIADVSLVFGLHVPNAEDMAFVVSGLGMFLGWSLLETLELQLKYEVNENG